MLPKLYSRRSDGKLQTWSVEVNGNQYRFISGIEDGAQTRSEWTTCQGKNLGKKNATTPEQQAASEAQSHWQKKRDKGYKEDPKDVDDVGYFEPMLAKEYDGNIKFPVYAQPKLDGVRCIVSVRGMFSRNGKPLVSAPHIKEALQPLLDADPSLIFDGELYADKFADDFNKIISLARQGKPTAEDLAESKEHLQYWVYDLPSIDGDFATRSNILRTHVKNGTKADGPIKFVETVHVGTQALLDELYGQWQEAGYEGQMVRLNAPYENKRTKSLLKRKEFKDSEFTIVDILEGTGNRSGMCGKMLFNAANGKTFESNVCGNREIYRELLANKAKYIGKVATVKYFNLTPDGVPRFPVVTKFDK